MKVQNSKIDLYGDFKLDQKRNISERLRFWVDGKSREANHPAESPRDSLVLSEESLARLQQEANQTKEASTPKEIMYELSPEDKELIALLERFLYNLTGKSVKIIVPESVVLHDPNKLSLQLPDERQVDLRNQKQGWGLDYQYEETYSETESMVFSSEGTIATEDGREIQFTISMAMNRQFFSSQQINIKAGDALIDPLVINFGSSEPKLTSWKTDFDLDGDGQQEKISFLEPESGFLVIDKNGDGIINDGKELFGPTTGDGFSELTSYDEDHNGWIDENDSIFNQLSIWIKDTEGNDQIVALVQKGIGAIYLKNVDTQYALKDNDNNLQAQIQKTGVFIREDGQAGTIQHIDLAI